MAAVNGVSLPELPSESLTLGSGPRVRLIPLPHLQSATVSFFLRVGSRYETAETNGLSHFLEHMLYRGHRGTSRCARGQPCDRTARGNARCGDPRRFHELRSDTADRDDRQRRRVARRGVAPTATDGSGDGEADHSRRDSRRPQRERSNRSISTTCRGDCSTRDHPLGFPIAGPLENLDRFETVDLRRHHARHYTGCNSVVCVAGAFEPQGVGDTIRSCFEGIQAGDPIEPSRTSKDAIPRRFSYVHEHGSQTDVRLSFHTPGVDERRGANSSVVGAGARRWAQYPRASDDLRGARAGLRGLRRERHL